MARIARVVAAKYPHHITSEVIAGRIHSFVSMITAITWQPWLNGAKSAVWKYGLTV